MAAASQLGSKSFQPVLQHTSNQSPSTAFDINHVPYNRVPTTLLHKYIIVKWKRFDRNCLTSENGQKFNISSNSADTWSQCYFKTNIMWWPCITQNTKNCDNHYKTSLKTELLVIETADSFSHVICACPKWHKHVIIIIIITSIIHYSLATSAKKVSFFAFSKHRY